MNEEAAKRLNEIKEGLKKLYEEKEITGFYLMVDRGFEDYAQEIKINLLQMCSIHQTMLNIIAYMKGYTTDEARKFIDALEEITATQRDAGALKEMMERAEDDE